VFFHNKSPIVADLMHTGHLERSIRKGTLPQTKTPRDVASMAVHKDTAADTSSICITVTDAGPYSTAVHHAAPAAADQNSSSHAMIGIAGDALHRQKDTTAAAADANLQLACVREQQPQQQPRRRCCCCSPKAKMVLSIVAVLVIVVGTALGVGLRFGLLAQRLQSGERLCQAEH
jgi:hypothetical protein